MPPTATEQPRVTLFQLSQEVANLHPAYFALVMATGIVSTAIGLAGHTQIAKGLFLLNIGAYLALWVLFVWRLVRYPQRMYRDACDHVRGPGFFTLVAGSAVLGRQYLTQAKNESIATILWFVALFFWFLTTYTFFTAVTIREQKPTLDTGLHGGWLLATVATQSLTVLGAPVAQAHPTYRELFWFAAVSFHLAGAVIYGMLITLIAYRFTFFSVRPDALVPPYWINMGAVAITTLAGASLVMHETAWPPLQALDPFLRGGTWLAWSIATWWIPLLFILGFWRHGYKRFAFRYDPQYWGMVFPLGMYSTCTDALAQALNLPFLLPLAHAFAYLALVAWSVVAAALLVRWYSFLRQLLSSATTATSA